MRRCTVFLLLSAVAVGCGRGDAVREDPPALAWESEVAQWDADIVIDGPAEDQRAVRSFIHHLRNSDPLTPFGGTNEQYAGRTFWDADVWVFPALAFIDPELARKVSDFRLRTAQRAQIQTLQSIGGYGRAMETLEDLRVPLVIRSLPLRFPWEANEKGEDVSPQHTKDEIHVSADVMWGMRLASDLGFVPWLNTDQIGRAVAEWYMRRSVKNENGERELRNVVSVDEWITGDNCLYTNAGADWVVRTFLRGGVEFRFPRDSSGRLTAYDGDPVRAYQQAAAPLVLWPLEREDLVDDPIAFLERFEGREAPSGPAMSLSVYALVRARYGDADVALATWRESWGRYTGADLQFSERPGREDLTYFLTGAAGCLNAVVYGFIGARVVDDASADSAKIRLENGRWLVFRPNLPSEWKRVTFRGLRALGRRYEIVCEGRKATVTTGGESP